MVLGVVLYLAFLLGSAVFFLDGLRRIYDGFQRHREANLVRDTPVSSLDAIAYGQVAVEGTVRAADRTLRAPLGAHDCVAYDLFVRDYSSSTDDVLVAEQRAVPFHVETPDGRVLVAPDGLDLQLSTDRTVEEDVEHHETPSPAVRAFNEVNGLDDWKTGHNRQYEQQHLRPGDTAYVYGVAELDADRAEREKPVVVTGARDPFFVVDRDRETLLRERRFGLLRSVAVGLTVATVSLAVFLWLSGIASIFLGA